jgi:hypothetical protein
VKLTEAEVAYLGTFENIPEEMMGEYTRYMTAGVCEIILVSKRAALYEAFALVHGCLGGLTDVASGSLKTRVGGQVSNPITVQVKKGRDVYEEELPIF